MFKFSKKFIIKTKHKLKKKNFWKNQLNSTKFKTFLKLKDAETKFRLFNSWKKHPMLYNKTRIKPLNRSVKYHLTPIKFRKKLTKRYKSFKLPYYYGLIPKKLTRKFNTHLRLNILKKPMNSNVGAFQAGLFLRFKNFPKNTLLWFDVFQQLKYFKSTLTKKNYQKFNYPIALKHQLLLTNTLKQIYINQITNSTWSITTLAGIKNTLQLPFNTEADSPHFKNLLSKKLNCLTYFNWISLKRYNLTLKKKNTPFREALLKKKLFLK